MAEINVASELAFEVVLKRPSTFLVEGLDFLISGSVEEPLGTGPFRPIAEASSGEIELRANEDYFAGAPYIKRIVVQPYESVRAAWADMLRGRVDMLYDVGVDALDSLEDSSDVNVFVFQRSYAYVGILNIKRPALRDKETRRALNASINRTVLVDEVFNGHAIPATSPVWPFHWAYDSTMPSFEYRPARLDGGQGGALRLSCVFADASLERLALVLQKELRAVGVDLRLELMGLDALYKRLEARDFDVLLADALSGPSLSRPYQFWSSGTVNNFGQYSSVRVDRAFEVIRRASSDEEYKAGVSELHRALIDDPPAIFLAWSQRARAVSARFEVPVEPGRDILGTLRLWRPVGNGTSGAEDLRERVH